MAPGVCNHRDRPDVLIGDVLIGALRTERHGERFLAQIAEYCAA